jgi:hypothetical protein
MTSADYVVIACGATMLVALSLGIYHRLKTSRGITDRFLKFLIIGMGVPAFIILAMTDRIDATTIGAIIMGVLAGFGISKTGKEE